MTFGEDKQKWKRDMLKLQLREGLFGVLVVTSAIWGVAFGLILKAIMGL